MQFIKRCIKSLVLLCIVLFSMPSIISHASERSTNDVILLSLNQEKNLYQIDRQLLYLVAALAVVVVILLIVLLIKYKQKSKSEKVSNQLNDELKKDYTTLESTYNEVTEIYKELKEQYDTLKATDEKNEKLAYTDNLTELPNRNAYTKKMDQILSMLQKDDNIALMYIDLDNFKSINDSLGHSYGDELLIDVSYRLKQVLDENDYLAHLGGDEFVIISQNIPDIGDYEEKIKKLQKFFSFPFIISQKEFFVTISIGVTFAPKDGKVTQTLNKNVDLAMYIAKKRGKNTYCYFDKAINDRVTEKMELQSDLKKATKEDEFEVLYQPQYNIITNRIVGFEALVRWNHPDKGTIEPKQFLPLAEETGLIVDIGEYVLRDACKQLKLWNKDGFIDISMAINLSVRQLKDSNIITMISSIVNEYEIDPSKLVIEITEDIAVNDIEYAISIIERLQELGIKFTLDDFGTGYSSMNYLKELSVHNIKIDKSYIEELVENKYNQKLVKAIVSLAHTLDLNVIAEGVESIEQAAYLKEIQCDNVQGFLYSKPISNGDASKLLVLEVGIDLITE